MVLHISIQKKIEANQNGQRDALDQRQPCNQWSNFIQPLPIHSDHANLRYSSVLFDY